MHTAICYAAGSFNECACVCAAQSVKHTAYLCVCVYIQHVCETHPAGTYLHSVRGTAKAVTMSHCPEFAHDMYRDL